MAAPTAVRFSTSALQARVPSAPPNNPCHNEALSSVRSLTAPVISCAQGITSSCGPRKVTTRWKMIIIVPPFGPGTSRPTLQHPSDAGPCPDRTSAIGVGKVQAGRRAGDIATRGAPTAVVGTHMVTSGFVGRSHLPDLQLTDPTRQAPGVILVDAKDLTVRR